MKTNEMSFNGIESKKWSVIAVMANRTKLYLIMSLAILVGVSACNGGSAGGAGVMGAKVLAGNNCFALVTASNGKNYTTTENSQPYYSTATINFSVQNTCATPQAISGLVVNVNGLTLNGSPALINYIGQGQNNPYLTLSYTTSGSNIAMNLSTPACSGTSCGWAQIAAAGISTFTVNAYVNAAINSFALGSISISGSTPPAQLGNLVITTGTIAEVTTFASIGNLNGMATDTKTKITYPFSVGINGNTTLNGLPAGDTYSVSLQGIADPLTGVYYNVTAANITIAANTTNNIALNFAKVTAAQHSVGFTITGAPSNQTIQFATTTSLFKYNVDSLNNGTYKFLTSEAAISITLNTPSGYTLSYAPNVITPTVTAFSATYSAIIPPPSKALTTQNDQIIDANGNVVVLKGINWFGFNNSDMLNGMWNYDGLSGDFEVTVRRLKALGFNAVRLPFSFANLNGSIQNSYQYSSVTPASTAQLISNLTNPSYSISGKTFPSLNNPSGETYANQYLPANTVMARFIYVINFFAKNGFYVLIDNHTEDNSITVNQATWTANWKILANNIVNGMPASSSKMVMYDLRNEPDAIGYNWTQMGPLYLNTMDAINSVTNGNNLFFIEGSGQGGASANWGDGFVTNSSIISQNGLSDPNSFFKSLASKAYLNQVVLSPHVYPPSVTNASSNFSGSGLYNRLSTSFGTLAKTGYCVSGVCHRFPIAIGEFGSNFVLANDLSFFVSFANYMNNANDAIDGLHNPINNWFYWDYNPNSGDTGGIVANDWTTIQWVKVNYLSNGTISGSTTNPNGLGLNPWYK